MKLMKIISSPLIIVWLYMGNSFFVLFFFALFFRNQYRKTTPGYRTDLEERRLQKLVQLRRRGLGPPKKKKKTIAAAAGGGGGTSTSKKKKK
jgi:hypothetical protein